MYYSLWYKVGIHIIYNASGGLASHSAAAVEKTGASPGSSVHGPVRLKAVVLLSRTAKAEKTGEAPMGASPVFIQFAGKRQLFTDRSSFRDAGWHAS